MTLPKEGDRETRKEIYRQITNIITDDNDYPMGQASRLTNLVESDGRLYLIFYLLLIALQVARWRRQGIYLSNRARRLEESAELLEALNEVETNDPSP